MRRKNYKVPKNIEKLSFSPWLRSVTNFRKVETVLFCCAIILFLLYISDFNVIRGRVDDLSFFEYLSPFCFLSIEFHCTFSFLIKYYHILFIIIVFWLGCDRPTGLLLFVPALLLSILTPLFFPSSSVSLSYFGLTVPIRECLGKHSCMSSPFPIAILNGTLLFREAK